MSKRVVITGVGVISPSGNGKDTFWENCVNGTSQIKKITSFDTTLFKTKYAGLVDFKPKGIVPKVIQIQTDTCTHYAFGAASEALKDSNIDMASVDANRFGVIIGNSLGGCNFGQNEMFNLYTEGVYAISPYMMTSWFYAATIGQLSIHFKLKGYSKTIVSEKASGTDAIGFAYNVIKNGDADIILTGGTEAPINEYGLVCLDQSRETIEGLGGSGDCTTAYRPFSSDRQGFFPAEGSGLVILEELEHALKRNAPIYGEVVGYASTNDGYHPFMNDPSGKQLTRAIKLSLDQAGITPDKLDYINLDAVGTEEGDLREAKSIKNALGDFSKTVYSSAPKSMYGHTIGAAGGIDFIETALSVKNDTILPTINCNTPDQNCDLNVVRDTALYSPVNYALSISCGFGGINSAILLKKYEK